MNKILNGDFSSGFDYWDNGIGEGDAFSINIERAHAASAFRDTDPVTYKMKQDFSINNEVITAKLTIWGSWYSSSGIVDGYIRFKVWLEKPDTSEVAILDVTKTAEIDDGNLLDEEDITAHLDQHGNYKLWLSCIAATCYAFSGPPAVYSRSNGNYDDINLDVAVKKYKSVHEKMGGSGVSSTHQSRFSTSVAESVGLSEARQIKVSKTVAEMVGLFESYSTEVRPMQPKSVAEAMGLIETYSTIKTLFRAVAESVGLVEAIQAKRTQGNVITTYDISDLTDWDEISQVTTPWVKTTVIIKER